MPRFKRIEKITVNQVESTTRSIQKRVVVSGNEFREGRVEQCHSCVEESLVNEKRVEIIGVRKAAVAERWLNQLAKDTPDQLEVVEEVEERG